MKVFYLMKHSLLVWLALITLTANAQTSSLAGKVLDETGQPLPGASVQIKNLQKSTTTTGDGAYQLGGLSNGTVTVTVSYIGYQSHSQAVSIKGNTNLNFNLKPSAESLNEVVVVGYGTQTRREITGSIAKVTGDQIASTPAPSFESALAGRAAGVQVTTGSGIAGSSAQIRIRGIGSISGGGEPLYVIDGIPMTSDIFSGAGANGDGRVRAGFNQNPLATLNPNDIESVDILKDAGAAGIYGSRGANGVILITTKRGKAGAPKFNFSSKVGLSSASNRPHYTNNEQWLQLRQEAWENDGNTGLAPLPANITWEDAKKTNTDWWDLTTREAVSQDYSLSVSGGGKKYKAFLSGAWNDNPSYIVGNSYKRLSTRGNLDYTFNDKLSASLSSSWAQGDNQRVLAAWAGGIGDAMSSALPIFPIYKDPATNDGNPYFFNGANPVRSEENTDWRTLDTRWISNVYLNYTPIKDLTIRVGGSLDYNDTQQDRYQSKYLIDGAKPINGQSLRFPVWVTNYNTNATATYNFKFTDKHKFTALAGIEYQRSVTKQYSRIELFGPNATGVFYKNPDLLDQATKYYVNDKGGLIAPDGRWAFASVFARLNYTYNDKFVIQALARTDGSSRFGPNNKYGFFPAISGAWIASQEDFVKSMEWVSLLKFRAGYGITGNANIPSDKWRSYYKVDEGKYGNEPIIYPSQLANPDLKWEDIRSIDLALEYGFLNNRITGEISYYNKKTTDALLNINLPDHVGYESQYRNLGKIRNQGFELSLNTRNIVGKDFSWTTNFNIATNNNKILDVGGLPSEAIQGGTNDTRVIVGYPIGTNFLVRYAGVDPADGNPIWLDKNGNQTKTYSPDNRVAAGKVTPDFSGGLTNTFNYKGFEFSTLFTFVKGQDLWDNSAKFQFQGASTQNWVVREDFFDRWRKPGDIAKYPRSYYNTANGYPGVTAQYLFNSNMFLYDGSYIKLKQATIAYTLPAEAMRKLKLSNVKFYLTGVNLLTFTKYPGGDPEVARDYENATDRNLSANVTYLTPPQQKSFILGVNLNF